VISDEGIVFQVYPFVNKKIAQYLPIALIYLGGDFLLILARLPISFGQAILTHIAVAHPLPASGLQDGGDIVVPALGLGQGEDVKFLTAQLIAGDR